MSPFHVPPNNLGVAQIAVRAIAVQIDASSVYRSETMPIERLSETRRAQMYLQILRLAFSIRGSQNLEAIKISVLLCRKQ